MVDTNANTLYKSINTRYSITTSMLHEIVNSAQARILDFFADNQDYDYNISDIARESKTSRPTVYKILDKLENEKMIINTRMSGLSKMYKLNTENTIIKSMLNVKEVINGKVEA